LLIWAIKCYTMLLNMALFKITIPSLTQTKLSGLPNGAE
jgi:hypothetical protein